MGLILKHTLRSVVKNKLQAAIIVITVVLVTALLFCAFSLSNVFYLMSAVEHNRFAAGMDMRLGSGEAYGTEFNAVAVESLIEEGDLEYADFFYRIRSALKTDKTSKAVTLEATDFYKYLKNHSLNVLQSADLEIEPPVDGMTGQPPQPAVIAESLARAAELKAGDIFEVYTSATRGYTKLYVSKICTNTGIFATDYLTVLLDFSALNVGRRTNSAYLKFTNPALYGKYENIFKEKLPEVSFSDAKSNEYAHEIAKNITMLMAIAVIFITAAMMLILLSSYIIIARHRTGDMIIFKAAGATPLQTAFIMLLEVLVYSVCGAVLGLAAGRIMLGIAVNSLLPQGGYILGFQLWKYALSFLISVLVTTCACLFPIISTSRKTIRQLTSGPQKIARKSRPVLAAVSLVVIAAGLIGIGFLSGRQIVFFTVFLTAASAVFIAFTTPVLIRLTAKLFAKIRRTGGVYLATKSVNRTKGLHVVSVLLSVLIVFSFMVFQLINMVKMLSTQYLTRFDADFVGISENKSILDTDLMIRDSFLQVDGVENVGFTNIAYLDIIEKGSSSQLFGVSDLWMLNHCTKAGLSGGTLDRWQKTENPIILSQDTLLRYGLEVGDTVEFFLRDEKFPEAVKSFVVVGYDKTMTEWDGISYVKYGTIEDISYTTNFFLTAKNGVDKSELFLNVRSAAESIQTQGLNGNRQLDGFYMMDVDDWANSGRKDDSGLKSLMSFLQAFLFAVSLLGVVNIAIVTAFDRKAEFALYRLSGMNKRDFMALSLGEGLMITITGGIIGFILCCAFSMVLPAFVAIVGRFMYFGILSNISLMILGLFSAFFMLIWMLIAAVRRFSRPEQIKTIINN